MKSEMPQSTRFASLTPTDFVPVPESQEEILVPKSPDRISDVLRVVKANPDGATASDIARVLGMSPPTALRLLRELEREREVYSRTLRRLQIWYPNGRLIHPYLEIFKEIRGRTYRFTIQEARSGPAVQIQERSFSVLTGEHVDGAIFVDYAGLDDLEAAIKELRERYESKGLTVRGRSP